ncbi:MAG: alkaline phosphatase family protein, partial [Candidatus Nanopelagicales bacterium]
IAPAAYARSGLTRAALRGSRYLTAQTRQERGARVVEVAKEGPSSLVYVYWADLDRAAHEFGCSSSEWRDAARSVNALLWQLRRSLPPGGALIVTADHGMVDCTDRIWLEDDPLFGVGVDAIAGEPRMRHVYVDADHDPEDVKNRWQLALGDRAMVLTRSEAIDTGLFGTCDPGLADRIGDVVAIAVGGWIMASRVVDERVSRLVGQHGAVTDQERRIPGLVLRG